MEKKQESVRLPYVQGAPGALALFAGMEAVAGVVVCILFAAGFAMSGWVNSLTMLFLAAGAALSLALCFGLVWLRLGNSAGALIARAALCGRRVLLWAGFGLRTAYSIISAVDASGPDAVQALLPGVIISLLIMLPVQMYYQWAENILEHVRQECITGQPIRPDGFRGLWAPCIVFAVILMAVPVLDLFGPYLFEQYDDSFMTGLLETYGMSEYFGGAMNLLMLILWLAGARFLVEHICFRGFMRSHRQISRDGEAEFTTSRLENSFGVCVLGSALFGWMALKNLNTYLFIDRFVREHKISEKYADYYPQILTCYVFLIAGLAILAVALMLRKGRTVAGILGSAAMIVSGIMNGLLYSDKDFYKLEKAVYTRVVILYPLLTVFFAVLILALVFRLIRKKKPAVLVIVLAGLALVTGLWGCLANWPTAADLKKMAETEAFMKKIYTLVICGGAPAMALIGLAGLAGTKTDGIDGILRYIRRIPGLHKQD